jgi:squalene-hopene/tetraprenyl-beta-curcumene cyclase
MKSAMSGCNWLLKLQNRDGGWPTFCKGWGALPFDRSGSDLTAHAIRALSRWRDHYPHKRKLDLALNRGWVYLERNQNQDGSWLPLWFGNQDRPEEDNPFYGTARVLAAYVQEKRTLCDAYRRGVQYLVNSQNVDGGWGGGVSIVYRTAEVPYSLESVGVQTSTVEETAVVLEGLLQERMEPNVRDSAVRGLQWLCEAILASKHQTSQPIGFYFARLWYHEQMYPLIFSLSALRKGLAFCQR